MDNLKKYLPSKKFISYILTILIIVILFFAVKEGISALKNRKIFDNDGNVVQTTVTSLVQKDSNNNGIEDWEEYIWGLDPTKDGEKNKNFIFEKKKELEKEGLISTEEEKEQRTTQNALLTRQLLATILTLQQEGEADEETLNSLSEVIGQEIKPTPISDIYTKDMLIISNDSEASKTKYLEEWRKVASKYTESDIGEELIIIAQGIVNNDKQAMFAVKSIAEVYRNYGKDLANIHIPTTMLDTHLELVNNYEKNAISIEEMTNLVDDPIVGMRGLLNYKKYNDMLLLNIEKLTEILQ